MKLFSIIKQTIDFFKKNIVFLSFLFSKKNDEKKVLPEGDEVLYFSNGKMNCKPDDNMDLSRGLYQGNGYSLTKQDAPLQRIYAPWSSLNSHKLTIGTTRQGKSRKMVSDVDQQIANNQNVFIGEPKGSDHQEIIGYVLQSLIKYGREKDYIYISPYHHEHSIKFNPLYRKKNVEITSLIGEIIESKEPVYKNIGRARVLAVALSLDFIEKYDEIDNPYDKIIMERMELAKLITDSANSVNKFIWEEEYDEKIHGVVWDIKKDLKENADPLTLIKIEEAEKRTTLRYRSTSTLKDSIPLRTFLTFKDISQFEIMDNLKILSDEVSARLRNAATRKDIPQEIKVLGAEATLELEKRLKDDPAFIQKLGTSFSMALTDLITGEVGILLNTCKINPLMDALTSKTRGAVIVYQPFPMIFSSASVALGRILFSMFSSMAGYIGASGYTLPKRLYINIDEAGAILSPIIQELSNKGGGLGFTLCLYTQSIADIIQTLEEDGCRILLDNMNTKEFFKVNDNTTASDIALVMGTIKKASVTTASSNKRDTRASTTIDEVEIASTSIIQRLDERRYLLKMGSDVYIVAAPHVDDTIFKIKVQMPSLTELSTDTDNKQELIKTLMEEY